MKGGCGPKKQTSPDPPGRGSLGADAESCPLLCPWGRDVIRVECFRPYRQIKPRVRLPSQTVSSAGAAGGCAPSESSLNGSGVGRQGPGVSHAHFPVSPELPRCRVSTPIFAALASSPYPMSLGSRLLLVSSLTPSSPVFCGGSQHAMGARPSCDLHHSAYRHPQPSRAPSLLHSSL